MRSLLLVVCLLGCATVATATTTAPQAVALVLGLLIVFVLPGSALVCAVLPDYQSSVERLLASLGLSLVVTTCTAVLLAATPLGLSRESLGVALGGFTILLSIWGMFRSRSTATPLQPGGPPTAPRLDAHLPLDGDREPAVKR